MLVISVVVIVSNLATPSIDNNIDQIYEDSSLIVSQPVDQQEIVIPITDNTCVDELRFGNPSYAYIGSQKYSFSEEQKVWIEANCPGVKKNISTAVQTDVDGIIWTYDMPNWIAPVNAPACTDPLEFSSPADLSLAVSILYPGQVRGTDYKTHGGLRFNPEGNSVTVRMPADAYLWRASKYDQEGEVQYLIEFISKCGIIYKFNHLLTLSPKLSEISNMTTSRTTSEGITYSSPSLLFNKDEVIAIEVGIRQNHNVGFDFGVIDLRQKNSISQTDPNYIATHMDDAETASNAICWLDYLEGENKALARSLPVIAVDATAESDYCN